MLKEQDTRPVVYLDDGELAEQADSAWKALLSSPALRSQNPSIAARGGTLVRIGDCGALEPLTEYGLKDVLARVARFGTTSANGSFKPKYPPTEVVRVLLDRDTSQCADVRLVNRVTTVPILGPDGVPIYDPGLNDSGVWYLAAPGLEAVGRYIGDIDDVDNVKAARDLLLDELLGDFEFADDASCANALGLTLLPFVREYIGDSPTPMHVVSAPQPGSGKSYLAQACLIPGCGLSAVSPQPPRDDEEIRKAITATLVAGQPAIIFDNLSRELASATLAAVLTAPKWTDRILGKTLKVALENRLVWVVTGNNVETSSELRDRVCPIWLEAGDGLPARKRPKSHFRHADLHRWALENRAQLAGACMTLVLHWLAGSARVAPDGSFRREEHRESSRQTMGSFERWADVIGGILAAADVSGHLMNRDKLEVVDIDEQETVNFLARVHAWSDGNEFAARDLAEACEPGGEMYEHVPNSLPPVRGRPAHVFGRWLAGRKNATYGGMTLRSRDAAGGTACWRVEAKSS